MQLFHEETARDVVLQLLCKRIVPGCPDEKTYVANEGWPYCPMRDELSICDGLVLCGERLEVPQTREPKSTRKYVAHTWEKAKLSQAKYIFYWPGMNTQVAELC